MAQKYIDPIFAGYARTALRLDIEFCLAHHPPATMPYHLALRFAALHDKCVQLEAKGRTPAGALRQEYWCIKDLLGADRFAEAGDSFYRSFWPTAESWEAFLAAERAELDATTAADAADLAVAS